MFSHPPLAMGSLWPAALAVTLLLAPAAPGAVAPPPAPSGTESHDDLRPLKEIGRVKATTPFCASIIDHATKAVTLGVDNDAKIDGIVRTMRSADFDSNVVSKSQALQALSNENVPLTEHSIAAEHAAKALRVDAKNAPSAEEAKNVIAFADALDGALHRQRTIARDLAGMIVIFTSRPLMTKMDREQLEEDAQAAHSLRNRPMATDPLRPEVPPLLTTVAQDGADEFVERQTGIVHDERAAADMVGQAFGGC